jgi:hypothetical protein
MGLFGPGNVCKNRQLMQRAQLRIDIPGQLFFLPEIQQACKFLRLEGAYRHGSEGCKLGAPVRLILGGITAIGSCPRQATPPATLSCTKTLSGSDALPRGKPLSGSYWPSCLPICRLACHSFLLPIGYSNTTDTKHYNHGYSHCSISEFHCFLLVIIPLAD